jgi:hypothetical protein
VTTMSDNDSEADKSGDSLGDMLNQAADVAEARDNDAEEVYRALGKMVDEEHSQEDAELVDNTLVAAFEKVADSDDE